MGKWYGLRLAIKDGGDELGLACGDRGGGEWGRTVVALFALLSLGDHWHDDIADGLTNAKVELAIDLTRDHACFAFKIDVKE